MRATVKWFNDERGYGFLTDGDGNEYFVHYRAIAVDGRTERRDGRPFRTLLTDEQVEIVDFVRTHQGLKATDVKRL